MTQTNAPFELHPQLAADTRLVGRWPLSLVLLMDDSRYPWCLLVPRRAGIEEIHHLEAADRLQLLEESVALARAMEALYRPEKLNVAALGNVVSQLHVHHVVRRRGDAAWPAPVWGRFSRLPYADEDARCQVRRLRAALADDWQLEWEDED